MLSLNLALAIVPAAGLRVVTKHEVPIPGSGYPCAIREDGRLLAFGEQATFMNPRDPRPVVSATWFPYLAASALPTRQAVPYPYRLAWTPFRFADGDGSGYVTMTDWDEFRDWDAFGLPKGPPLPSPAVMEWRRFVGNDLLAAYASLSMSVRQYVVARTPVDTRGTTKVRWADWTVNGTELLRDERGVADPYATDRRFTIRAVSSTDPGWLAVRGDNWLVLNERGGTVRACAMGERAVVLYYDAAAKVAIGSRIARDGTASKGRPIRLDLGGPIAKGRALAFQVPSGINRALRLPEGAWLAEANDGVLFRVDKAWGRGTKVGRYRLRGWSPSGRWILVARPDGSTQLWEASSPGRA
ncbi:MAG: hypothetical protein KIS66_06655 [Fimbriimonadaceae bacterium]|nr:hypothetical protein [Fimbriimonadaceae bacterium]